MEQTKQTGAPNGAHTPGDDADEMAARLWRKSAPDECAFFAALCWSIADETGAALDRLCKSDFKHKTSGLIYEASATVRGRGELIHAETLFDECTRRADECDRQSDVSKWEIARGALLALQAPKGDADKIAAELSHKIAPHSAQDWGEPLPLKNALFPVPALPDVLIPAPLRSWVCDCAERIGVAPDYIAVSALVSLASLVGNTVSIRPKQRDDWRVVLNLWGGLIGDPSVKKSPAIAEGTKPLARLKALEIERHREAAKEFEGEALLNEIGADALKAELKKLKKAGAGRDELKAYIEQMQEIENAAPTLKTYSVQDATIEALTKVLERNPRGFLIERDELTGWLRALEKQGHEQDRAFYLEAFNGTAKNQQIERVGRGTIIVPHFTISILGTIQPGPFCGFIRAASSAGTGADGFVARFQMLVYPDPLPEYKHVDRYPNTEAKNRAFAIFEKLDALTPEAAGAQCDDGDDAPFLRFDGEAQAVFDDWIIALENRLPTLGVLIEQHLAKYRSLMPSLALLFHLIGVADGSAQAGAVSADATMMAAEWCQFLEAHARRIYARAVDGATDGAELIATRLGHLPNPFTLRDVHQKQWAGLSERGDVENALARLQDRGWLLSEVEETGGRPKETFWKHPAKAGEK
jgi:putative DNA primase/helicase